MKSTITFDSGHRFQEGDLISIDVPDRRRWPRFKAWLLRRPAPMKRQYYVCQATTNTTAKLANTTDYGYREISK